MWKIGTKTILVMDYNTNSNGNQFDMREFYLGNEFGSNNQPTWGSPFPVALPGFFWGKANRRQKFIRQSHKNWDFRKKNNNYNWYELTTKLKNFKWLQYDETTLE
jgi:hypothetical protein